MIGRGGGRPGATLDLWFNDLYGRLYGLFSFVWRDGYRGTGDQGAPD